MLLVLPDEELRPQLEHLLDLAPGEPVTARALRRTAVRLFQSGHCRDVVVTERPAPGAAGEPGRRVSLEVACLPHRLLAEATVVLDGPSPLTPGELRAAAGLPPGGPVDDDDVEAARQRVRAALRRRGHLRAEVTASLDGEGPVTVTLRVRAGEAARLASLRLPGAGPAEAGLLARLALRPGDVLDEDRLAGDLQRLRAGLHAEGWRRARVGAPAVQLRVDGVEVEIPVEPGPRVAVAVRGAVAFTEVELRARLGLDAGQAFDRPAVDDAAERLRAFYRARGFAAARVHAEERPAGADLAVVFHVDEGRRYRLREVRWEGARWRTEEALRRRLLALVEEEAGPPEPSAEAERARALLASVPGAPPLREPPPAAPAGQVLDEVQLERAAALIVEDYRAEGFLEAALLGWRADLDAARGVVDVTLRLREGERTTVESIDFEGQRALPLAELAREARLGPGDPLAWEKVEATRVAILARYQGRGHVYARVEAREAVDPARHVAALRFVVDEGPQVRIGRILLTGNARTRSEVVRRALAIREGSAHDPAAMARAQSALLGLGVFRSVGLRLQDPEVPEPVKDLVVELAERPWQYLATGAGFSIANGPRVFLEYGRPNLLGRALELTARAKVNYPIPLDVNSVPPRSPKNAFEGRADAGLRAPRLDFVPVPVTGRTNLIAERLHRRAYDLGRVAGVLGADLPLGGRAVLSLQYEIEVDQIAKSATTDVLTQADLERLRFDEGTTTLHGIRPSFTIDHRDSASHPHAGWYATGSAEYSRSIGGPGGRALFLPGSEIYTNLVKLQGTVSGYLPMGATVLALSARGGRIVPLDDRSRTIIPKRFFLGGASTIRGFAEEEMVPEDVRVVLDAAARHCASSLSGAGCTATGRALVDGQRPASQGGELFLLLKGELRLPVSRSVELGLFLDAGNLWERPGAWRLLEVRPSAGVGLRLVTPAGPAALDVGFNLQPDARINERTFGLHFAIGLF